MSSTATITTGTRVGMGTFLLLAIGLASCRSKIEHLPSAPTPDATRATVASPGHPEPLARQEPAVPSRPAVRSATQTPDLRERMESAAARLSRHVRSGATDPTNAWALAHGLLAFGKELRADDGRFAVDVLMSFGSVVQSGDKSVVVFPKHTNQKIPVAPHADLFLKKMAEAHVENRRAFVIGGRRFTFQELLDDALHRFVVPTSDEAWHDVAWTLAAQWLSREPATALDSKLKEAAIATMARLESEQSFLEQLMQQKRPDLVVKRKQGIFSHTCGGLHLVDAAILGAHATNSKDLLERAGTQLNIVFFRWEAERTIYASTAAKAPQYRLIIEAQELKFFGHVLETLARAAHLGLLPKGPATQKRVEPIILDLLRSVDNLTTAYEGLTSIRQSAPQTYLDLVGDGCHAIHGLREGIVAFF